MCPTDVRHIQHGQYPQAVAVEDFRHNLAVVQARMAAACLRVGRDPAEVRLLPVSKTKPEASIRWHTLRDRLRQGVPAGIGPDELSMGMSGDFEIAIEDGATVVRVGQAIFSARGFGVAECELLAGWLCDVLDALEGRQLEAVTAQVREKVVALCRRYPVYR